MPLDLIESLREQANEARLGEKAARETVADRDAEIAKLRAELAEERAADPSTVTTAVEGPRPATIDEMRAYMRNLDIQPRACRCVPPIVAPAADPRVDAIGRLLVAVAERLGMESEMSKDRWDWVHDAFKARR